MDISQVLVDRVVKQAIEFQQIASPTFAERQRALLVMQRFQEEALVNIHMDSAGNVYACLPGESSKPPLVISAHMDTVFPIDTDLAIKRKRETIMGAGIGDNSISLAALLGLVWLLRDEPPLPGDVWLVANVCEEGLGDLKGMRAVVEKFGRSALAYLVLEGMSLGFIYRQGLAVRRYRVTAKTPGGHSWSNYGVPSAIHALARLITRLDDLPLSTQPRTTMNVGTIHGGTSVNTIAAEAYCEVDLRSESSGALAHLSEIVLAMIEQESRPGSRFIRFMVEVIGDRPAGELPAAHPLVRLAEQALIAQGIDPKEAIGSTDANIPLSLGIPCVCIGVTEGKGAHTLSETIHIPPLSKGLAQLTCLVKAIFTHLAHETLPGDL